MSDKYDILLIRACKCREPFKRIRSLYKRRYLITDQYYDVMINDLLMLCDKYNLCTVNKYNNDLNNNISKELLFNVNNSINLTFNDIKRIQMNTLISIIRYISVDRFDNFIPSKKFK